MRNARNWVLPKLTEAQGISGVSSIKDDFIEVITEKDRKLIIGVISDKLVEGNALTKILSQGIKPDFLMAIPGNIIWTGEAITLTRENNLGWGGMGDFLRSMDSDSIFSVQKKEYEFVERGLLQHTNIKGLIRIFDRVFEIKRYAGNDLTVVLVNEYELTADNVRTTRDQYGNFNIILKTNPNGRITAKAEEIAESLSVEILGWGDLLRRVNKA